MGHASGAHVESTERGSMLVEMVVTLFLLGIVMSVLYTSVSSLTGATEGTSTRLQNLDEARLIMAATTKDVRTATSPDSGGSAFISAKSNELIFYANVNNPSAAASQVHLLVNGSTELVEQVTPATNAAGTAACTQQPCSYLPAKTKTRFVGRFVVNDASQPLFTYLAVGGTALPAGPGGLDASQMIQVRSVRVSLAVSKNHVYSVGTTWMENTVGLPNVAFQQAT